MEIEVLKRLLKTYERVSYEHFCSMPGLVNVYRSICDIRDLPASSLTALEIVLYGHTPTPTLPAARPSTSISPISAPSPAMSPSTSARKAAFSFRAPSSSRPATTSPTPTSENASSRRAIWRASLRAFRPSPSTTAAAPARGAGAAYRRGDCRKGRIKRQPAKSRQRLFGSDVGRRPDGGDHRS